MSITSRILILITVLGICCFWPGLKGTCSTRTKVNIAVEFNDHAACAYIAKEKGWFREEGLKITSFDSYTTGMGIAAALARGDIQVAYLCLIPALNVWANAEIPIKVVAGTHKYGYGIVVNPEKIRHVSQLETPGIRIGCVREGGVLDVLLHRVIDRYGLNSNKVLRNIRRMPPTAQLIGIKRGLLDVAFLPEQWASTAEDFGFKLFLTAKDLWPGMQGSVLIVTRELISSAPETVRTLVKVTKKSTLWINAHPREAATIVSHQLSVIRDKIPSGNTGNWISKMEMEPETILRSMKRLEYTFEIDPAIVHEMFIYLESLGYVKRGLESSKILNLEFLK